MQIVILAAGRGTRMKNLTDEVPKPMLLIKGKPILAHKLEALPKEIDEVIFVIGYLGDQIKKYFGNEYAGKKISYVEQKELNGTGGAITLIKDLIDDEFLVMMGDDLYAKEDIERVMQHDLAVLGLEVDDPWKFGIILFDEKGNLTNIVEKPDMPGPALANIALYKLNKKIFEYPLVALGNGEYGLPQTMMQMKDRFAIAVEKAQRWFPVGCPEDLEKAGGIIDEFV